jgi:hypothetical protein
LDAQLLQQLDEKGAVIGAVRGYGGQIRLGAGNGVEGLGQDVLLCKRSGAAVPAGRGKRWHCVTGFFGKTLEQTRKQREILPQYMLTYNISIGDHR